MKKSALVTLLIGAVVCSISVNAQQKIGHISLDSLVRAMPEMDSATKGYSTYQQKLQSEDESMQKEFMQKQQDYQQNKATYTAAKIQLVEQELKDMYQRIQGYEQQAQASLQPVHDSLIRPVIAKAKAAISAVAKENGYKYILDASQNSLSVLYYEESDDVYALVAKKLGLKPKSAQAPMPKGPAPMPKGK